MGPWIEGDPGGYCVTFEETFWDVQPSGALQGGAMYMEEETRGAQ